MHDTLQEEYEQEQQALRDNLTRDPVKKSVRAEPMKARSTGDIVTMKDGTRYRVDHRGWKRL